MPMMMVARTPKHTKVAAHTQQGSTVQPAPVNPDTAVIDGLVGMAGSILLVLGFFYWLFVGRHRVWRRRGQLFEQGRLEAQKRQVG